MSLRSINEVHIKAFLTNENQNINMILASNIQNLKASAVPYALWNASCEIVTPHIAADLEGKEKSAPRRSVCMV